MENRLEHLKTMIKEYPEDEFLQYAIGLEYWGEGHYGEALAWLESLKQTNPFYLPTYYQLGKLYEAFDDDEAALTIYNEGIELAKSQNNQKTLEELQEAYEEISESDF